jgi:hypothetical protein
MKRVTTILGLLALSVGVSRAADQQQAFLGVFAETTSFKMVGMLAMPQLPPGVKLPPEAQQALAKFAGPQRKLTVRLWSPGIAPDNAFASLAVPEGLKQGPKLDLALYRPKTETGSEEETGPGGPGAFDTEMVIKQYWGSSATVRPGQPEITEFKGLTEEQKITMRQEATKARQGNSYFYKPNWTTGYWPTGKQPGLIDADAALVGHYALATNYTGNVEFDVPDKVNFLVPIEMSSPQLEEAVPLNTAILFRWKAIPNALGYHASIIGMQGKKTLILWSSSEVRPHMGFGYDFLQMAEVANFVQKQIFMAGDRVEVTVPTSIFKECDTVFMQMIGWGPGSALDQGRPLPRVQTKTTLSLMLGGKAMTGRPGFGVGEAEK